MSKYIWLVRQFVLQLKIRLQTEMLYLPTDSKYILKYKIIMLLI